jgi:hypothetical protein
VFDPCSRRIRLACHTTLRIGPGDQRRVPALCGVSLYCWRIASPTTTWGRSTHLGDASVAKPV